MPVRKIVGHRIDGSAQVLPNICSNRREKDPLHKSGEHFEPDMILNSICSVQFRVVKASPSASPHPEKKITAAVASAPKAEVVKTSSTSSSSGTTRFPCP